MTPQHSSFVIERNLACSPRHAFRFWSDPVLKERWNACHPDWTTEVATFEFNVGGGERKVWRTPSGEVQTYTAHYLDIVAEARIIYAYEMSFAGARLSASLVTILLAASGRSCRMTYTEQVALLTGGAEAGQQRLMGTEQGLDRLVQVVGQ